MQEQIHIAREKNSHRKIFDIIGDRASDSYFDANPTTKFSTCKFFYADGLRGKILLANLTEPTVVEVE